MKPDETLNVYSKSDDWRARILSNFSPDSFLLDGESLASVEGFIQGIKFPEGHPRRLLAFRSAGITAKRLGINIAPDSVWWKHQPIPYGSAEHRNLIERAIRAKYEQNSEAKDALFLPLKAWRLRMNLTSRIQFPFLARSFAVFL